MTKFKDLKNGDVLSETQFYKVLAISGDKVKLGTESGQPVTVDQGYVEKLLVSANQSTDTKKITRTELAEMLLTNPYVAMTVNFNKQIKEADIKAEIQKAYDESTPKEFSVKMAKAVKRSLEGEERTIVGYHGGGKDDFGRVHFTDMQIDRDFSKATYDNRHRLVDPRTVNWLILKGVKYIAK